MDWLGHRMGGALSLSVWEKRKYGNLYRVVLFTIIKLRVLPPLLLALTWSPDSTRVATAGSDKVVQIWDASDGQLITVYKEGHHKFIRCVSWSPNGQHIASCEDMELHIWNALSGQHILTFIAHPKL